MKKLLSLLVVAVMIAACNQRQQDNDMHYQLGIEEEMAPATRHSPGTPPLPIDILETQDAIQKKIIKDGRLGLKVTDLQKTKDGVDALVKKYGGYYSNERFFNTDWESSFALNVRIPATSFENFIAEIESGDAEILYKEIDARDVTDQFIDLETRLETKRNYLKRYNDLLQQAKTVKDILEVEEKIRALAEEIESTTGRLKYLSNLVDYSTLDLSISKQKDFKYIPTKRDQFLERLKQSLSKGWFGFVDFLLFLVKIWPFIIIASLLFFFWKKYKRRKRKN
jgi:hypothetical protein